MCLTAASWKTPVSNPLKIQIKCFRGDRSSMNANEVAERMHTRREEESSDKPCQPLFCGISKSHMSCKVCISTKSLDRELLPRQRRRFDFRGATFDEKNGKLGQFSIWSKGVSFLFFWQETGKLSPINSWRLQCFPQKESKCFVFVYTNKNVLSQCLTHSFTLQLL